MSSASQANCVSRAASIALVLCLLVSSTPAAPQTIVAITRESRVSFAFWFHSSGFSKLLQGRGSNPRRQETQADRDAKIARLEIFPKNATVDLDSRVRFSAVVYDGDGSLVGGAKIKWSAQNVTLGRRAPISNHGEFRAMAAGSFSISAETNGKTAQVTTVIVRPGVRHNLNLPPIGTRNVSTRDLPSVSLVSSAKSEQSQTADRISGDKRAKNRSILAAKRSHARGTSNPPSASPLMLPGDGWDETNYLSADDPGNRVGDPPGGPMDGGAGSGNFQFSAPIYGAAGRGINISLAASYNSRLWNKAGNQITYDIDRGWPAPGFNLGFGKLLGIGVYSGCMLVDADGTRHGYTGTINEYSWGTYGVMHTTDGSFIDYTYSTGTNGIITSAQAQLPNGTVINYGAYSQAGGGVFPTSIEDANGNFITITYVNNTGPRIQTVTDTLGRVAQFYYDSNNLLTAIAAPGFNNGPGSNVIMRDLVRFHYRQISVTNGTYSFSGMNTVVRDSSPWVIDAIYYPATNTGYWFNDNDSYSTYGMIRKVSERRNMSFSCPSLMPPGQGPTEQCTINSSGSITRAETYNYPAYVGDPSGTQSSNLTDAPTYTSMTEEWTRDGTNVDSATTGYFTSDNATNPDQPTIPSRKVEITLPNQVKSIQYSYNYTSLPDSDPRKALDGVVYQDQTQDSANNVLQGSVATWEKAAYDTPRPTRVEKIDERGQTTAAAFSYGDVYNQVIEVRDYDYGGTNLLRSTRTTYQNGTNYTGTCYSTGCVGRHIFNLPLTVEIYAADNVTRVSRTDYQYDGQSLSATPNVGQHHQAFNPHAEAEGYCSSEPNWNDPDCRGSCLPNCPECIQEPGCDGYCPEIYNCPYNPATDYRGNVTQVTTYADAAYLAGAVTETRRYDTTGNLVAASTSCCEQTSFNYTSDTQYGYPQSQTRGSATDANAQLTTSFTYDFNTGLMLAAKDANGRESETDYDPATLRVTVATLPTGAHTHFSYDDAAMQVATKTYSGAHDPDETTVADESVKQLDGRGQVRQEKARGPDNGQQQSWDAVDVIYNNLGEVHQQSRPYRAGGAAPVYATASYDSLGRATRVTAPDGSVTETYYNERDFDTGDSYVPQRPDVASNEPGETTLVRDAWGRERWGRTDASGRLVEVVEPNPNGNGSVATGGFVTRYLYNTFGSLTQIIQGEQTRWFKHDSLGRLTAQKLAEVSATLNDAGTYVGVAGAGAQWGDVFTYDDRSNLTSRTDARGVKTVYSYGGDPLNRLQSVSWDTSGFGDTNNPILPAATVTYQYRQKTSGAELKDITQLESVTTAGISTESYGFDAEGRVSSKTLTLTSRPNHPFETNYTYDNLDRVTDVLYPKQYGNGQQPRKQVHHDYDIASRLSGLTYDGQSFASNIVYNAASQTTSLNVGTGANQITESYGYNAQTGLLENQTVVRGGTTTLLNLSYDYLRAGTPSGRTGQLTKILNNLNHNKDRGYSYDALGRLVQATGGPATAPLWTQTYSYDRYGNRTSVNSSGYSARGGTGVPPVDHAQDARATTARAQHIVSEPPASAGGSSVSESRAVATGSNTQASTAPPQLIARNEIEPPPFLRDDTKPLSDSPPTLRGAGKDPSRSARKDAGAPAPQSGPPTFTDDPLNDPNNPESFKIKALHITELRTWINALRVRRGFTNYVWQKPTASGGAINNTVLVSWEPIDEMRTALNGALGPPPAPGYAPGLAVNEPIQAVHIQELRNRVKNNWNVSVAIPRDGHASLSYDTSSNRITTAGFEYDAAGNQVRAIDPNGSTPQRFQYDAANRLVVIRDGNNVVLATHIYGDSNERLAVAEAGDTTYYVAKGGSTIAEYADNGTAPVWSKSYVYLGNRLLTTQASNGSGGETTQFHHPDRLGTRIVSDPQTGSFFEQQTLPFGTALNESPPSGATSSSTNRRFTTYDRSAATGLDYAVNRHYDSSQGRFTQVDPAGMNASDPANPQTLNMYAYCANDPVNRIDPDGLGLISFFKKIGSWIKKHWKIIVLVAAIVAFAFIGAAGFAAVSSIYPLSGFIQEPGRVVLRTVWMTPEKFPGWVIAMMAGGFAAVALAAAVAGAAQGLTKKPCLNININNRILPGLTHSLKGLISGTFENAGVKVVFNSPRAVRPGRSFTLNFVKQFPRHVQRALNKNNTPHAFGATLTVNGVFQSVGWVSLDNITAWLGKFDVASATRIASGTGAHEATHKFLNMQGHNPSGQGLMQSANPYDNPSDFEFTQSQKQQFKKLCQ